MSDRTRRRTTLAAVAMLLVAAAACGSDESGDAASSTTAAPTTASADTTPTESLTILVSNDDGVGAPGIDVLVNALSELPDTEVVVVAPAAQQSGTGGSTTDGELVAEETTTASGVQATAVQGFPADAVNWALGGGIDVEPDLVITGINSGQNLGSIGDQVSGTVGAARAAAARGIPALAVSSGQPEEHDFDTAATFVLDWLEEHRDALLAGDLAGDEPLLENLNVPTCTSGEVRGLVEVPMATVADEAIAPQDCTSTEQGAADDITAFNQGFATLSDVTLEPAA